MGREVGGVPRGTPAPASAARAVHTAQRTAHAQEPSPRCGVHMNHGAPVASTAALVRTHSAHSASKSRALPGCMAPTTRPSVAEARGVHITPSWVPHHGHMATVARGPKAAASLPTSQIFGPSLRRQVRG